MSYSKKLTLFVLMIIPLIIISCKSPEEPKVTFPENDLPVSTSSDEALTAFMTGLEIYDQGNATKARPYFDKALELDPNFVNAQMYRAYTANSAKDWAENRDKFLDMRDKANESEAIQMDIILADMEDDEKKESKKTNVVDYLEGKDEEVNHKTTD